MYSCTRTRTKDLIITWFIIYL